ncbi:MAG: hypothetical protein QW724_08225, partial [Nitrososphaerota archaeon]
CKEAIQRIYRVLNYSRADAQHTHELISISMSLLNFHYIFHWKLLRKSFGGSSTIIFRVSRPAIPPLVASYTPSKTSGV